MDVVSWQKVVGKHRDEKEDGKLEPKEQKMGLEQRQRVEGRQGLGHLVLCLLSVLLIWNLS